MADSLLKAMVTRLENEKLLSSKEIKKLHIRTAIKTDKVYEY